MRRRKFTLVEIMIVVAIIGLLAAIAIPNFIRARQAARANACIENMRAIDFAKVQWATENNGGEGDSISNDNVNLYVKGNEMPVCPAGGNYTVGTIGTPPDCDYGDGTDYPHNLP